MSALSSFLPVIQIVLSVILISSVLLQQSGAGLGGAFGSFDLGPTFHTKRGFEKVLFITSIVVGTLFALSAILVITI